VIAIEACGADDAHRLAVAKVEATLLEPVVMIHRFYRLAERSRFGWGAIPTARATCAK